MSQVIWPDDINERHAWPDHSHLEWIDEFIERLDGLTLECFREACIDEDFDCDDAALIADAAAKRCSDPLAKVRWLQEPLLAWNLWPETWGDYWHGPFIDLMSEIIEVVGSRLADEDSATDAFDQLMLDDNVWYCAVGPAAIMVQSQVRPASVDAVLQTFIHYWPALAGEVPPVPGQRIDCEESALALTTPLLAIACLNPSANADLSVRVAEICSSRGDLANEFWEYVTGCIAHSGMSDTEHDRLEWWCPSIAWREGFFESGVLQNTSFRIGPEQLRRLVSLFLGGYRSWSLENLHGELTVPETAMAAFATRPELTDSHLSLLAVQPWQSTRSAVIANVSASDATKTLAALGD